MDSRRVAAAEITKRRNDIRGLKEAGAVTAATQGRATEAKGREMTAKRAREGDSISTSAEQDRGASGRMGVAAVATARGIDNRPAWMTEGQGVKRARELEEAGVATRAARAAAGAGLEATGTASTKRAAAEGGAMAAMSRPLKVGKPSQVKHNERRSLAMRRGEHEADSIDVATKRARYHGVQRISDHVAALKRTSCTGRLSQLGRVIIGFSDSEDEYEGNGEVDVAGEAIKTVTEDGMHAEEEFEEETPSATLPEAQGMVDVGATDGAGRGKKKRTNKKRKRVGATKLNRPSRDKRG